MEKRPKIKLELNFADKTVEAISWLALALLWFFVLFNYSSLPKTIANHFNFVGEIDDYGNKEEIFTLPLISTFISVVMTIFNKYPHIFNYPTAITTENALAQYTNATRMFRILKLAVVFIFTIITSFTLKAAHQGDQELEYYFYQ